VTERSERRTLSGILLAIWVLALLQSPGRTAFDTKLDLTEAPGAFLSRSLHLWNPQAGFGELQNQAYGYLFPMGPFFWVGHQLAVPAWLTQGVWTALLLSTALLGIRALLSRLEVGTPGTRLLAAAAYALAPRMLTVLGPISAEALPVALLPWAILPLLGALDGRRSARRAAALSGVAILLMGGVNASLVLAVLPIPVLWILLGPATHYVRAARARLLAWWAAACACACAWWIVPLLLLGRYGGAFLDRIESAANTTAPLAAGEVLRGTTHWVAHITDAGEPWWPAGWWLVTSPVAVIVTWGLALLGAAGLLSRALPARRALLTMLVVGLVALAAGYTGPFANPYAGAVREALDGPLAPFRNVHKFDPLVRLPFAVGLAHVVAILVSRASNGRLRSVTVHRAPSAARPLMARAVFAIASVLVGASALPLLTGLRPGPYWSAMPAYWQQAADFVADSPPGTRTLLLPASGFGRFTWGRTIDEPMQALSRSPWVVRNQVPFGADEAVRMLDAVDEVIGSGRGSPALAAYLARAGISRVLVRNDLDWRRTGAPRPSVVHQALDRSPGLSRVASFGPVFRPPDRNDLLVISSDLDPPYPAIEVFEIEHTVSVARAVAVDSARVVTGGAEGVLRALEQSVLAPRAPTLGVDRRHVDGPDVVTDLPRRRERNMGRVHDAAGETLTEEVPWRLPRRTHDLASRDPLVIAEWRGVRKVRASSSRSYADSLGAVRSDRSPAAAVDGDEASYWQSAALSGPIGQWLEVELAAATEVPRVELGFVRDLAVGPAIARVRVTTDSGTVETPVGEDGSVVVIPSAGRTRSVRVTVTAVAGSVGQGDVGVREFSIAGVQIERPLVVPAPVTADTAMALGQGERPRATCVLVVLAHRCDSAMARGTEEMTGLDRVVTLEGPGRWRIRATALAQADPAVQELLQPLLGGVTAVASSTLGGDAAVGAGRLVDGNLATSWVADPTDAHPTVTLHWQGRRSIDRIVLRTAEHPVASRPLRIRLESDDGSRELDVSAGGATFAPLSVNELSIRFVSTSNLLSLEPGSALRQVAVGVAEVEIPALSALIRRPDPDGPTGSVCGFGPPIVVDGQLTPTRAEGRIRDVLDGLPLDVVPCGAATVNLGVGTHRIRFQSTRQFLPMTLTLVPEQHSSPAVEERLVAARLWGAVARDIEVASGAESLLVVPENVNTGWQATLDGRRLRATTVDGWQQAWVVPAGSGGLVRLRYTPDRVFRRGLFGGALCGVVLVLTAAIPERRRDPRRVGAPTDQRSPQPAAWVALVSTSILGGLVTSGVMGAVAVAVLLAAGPGRFRRATLVLAGVAATSYMTVRRLGYGSVTSARDAMAQVLGGLVISCLLAAWVEAWRATGQSPSRLGRRVTARVQFEQAAGE
jgi:arabinofuranan 3-O-arabinosyltransferase